MRKKSIVIIDSGVGGIHFLHECVKSLPNYDYVYIIDTLNSPYGTKSKGQLKKIVMNLVREIIKKYNPEIILFACNTLTVNTISYVREKFFKVKFVGVEPALKPAKIFGGETILFATKSTIKCYAQLNKKIEKNLRVEYKEDLIKYHKFDKVYKIYDEKLPTLIDENIDNLDVLKPYLSSKFNKMEYLKCINMVLGCTHFIAIKEQLNDIFPEIKFFDGVNAVVRHIKDIAYHKDFFVGNSAVKVDILTTDKNKEKLKKFKDYYEKLNNIVF